MTDAPFINLDALASDVPQLRENGDVVHPLYCGAPRSRAIHADGSIDLMIFQCLLCVNTSSARPHRSVDGLKEHFRRFHKIATPVNVLKGCVSQEFLDALSNDGVREEIAVVDHPCNYCRAMIRAGQKHKRAEIDGVVRDACLACKQRLREEWRRARSRAAVEAATNDQVIIPDGSGGEGNDDGKET